jgi:hypothetical protein
MIYIPNVDSNLVQNVLFYQTGGSILLSQQKEHCQCEPNSQL